MEKAKALGADFVIHHHKEKISEKVTLIMSKKPFKKPSFSGGPKILFLVIIVLVGLKMR